MNLDAHAPTRCLQSFRLVPMATNFSLQTKTPRTYPKSMHDKLKSLDICANLNKKHVTRQQAAPVIIIAAGCCGSLMFHEFWVLYHLEAVNSYSMILMSAIPDQVNLFIDLPCFQTLWNFPIYVRGCPSLSSFSLVIISIISLSPPPSLRLW